MSFFSSVLLSAPSLVGAEPERGVVVLGWANILDAASQLWASQQGAVLNAQVRGLARAEDEVAGRWRALQLQSFDDVALGPQISAPYQITHYAQATVDLGSAQAAQRASYSASRDEVAAWSRAAEAEFTLVLLERFEAWWAAEVLARHIAEHESEFEAQLRPLAQAHADGWLTPLDWSELQLEQGRLRAEVATARRAARERLAEMEALSVLRLAPEVPAEDVVIGLRPEGDSVWAVLLQGAASGQGAPAEQLAWQMTAARQAAEARAAEQATPWQLFIGLNNRFEGPDSAWVAGTVGVNIPLSNPGRAEAERLSAEAAASQARAMMGSDLWRAKLESLRAGHLAMLEETARLEVELVRPAAERLERLERAFADRLVSADRLARAWRDMHEVHHRSIALLSEVAAREERARALTQWLAKYGGAP